ncbi:MAG: EamA family transporter [Oscillospiraceae bacterium]|nr:EamA family transporter [Oscillospiraceae bacterium]
MTDDNMTAPMAALKRKYTIYGLIAVFIWGTSTALGRSLAESLGNITSTAITCFCGGAIALFAQIRTRGRASFGHAPLKYWLICMPTMVLYRITVSLSIGIAQTREQVVTSSLIRQAWPLMTLIIAVIMFRKENKVSKWFIASVLVCLCGIFIANASGSDYSVRGILANMQDALWPCLLAFISSVAWGLYSNFNRLLIGNGDYDCVGIFLMASGVICFVISLFVDEPRQFEVRQLGELLYSIVFIIFLATVMWNTSMRRGNHMIVIYVANFLPVIATVISAVFLHVSITPPLIIGSLLVVVGTVWAKMCIRPVAPEEPAQDAAK